MESRAICVCLALVLISIALVAGVRGKCMKCQLSSTEGYPGESGTVRGNTSFNLTKDCRHYQCRCNCDGSWKCPREHTRNLCKGEVPGGCRSCVVSDDEFYPGNSNFEMVKNCIHYKCRCSCDGSYRCPGDRARRVCVVGPNGDEKPIIQRPRQRKCQQCLVSKRKERKRFKGNTTFSITEGCYRRRCFCKCDGSYECPSDRTINICNDAHRRRIQITQAPRQSRCRTCRVSGKEYAGNSSFSYTRSCNKYMCSCSCNGRYNCPAEKTIDVCRGNRDNTHFGKETATQKRRRTQCQTCHVSGKEYAGNTNFSFTNGCSKYRCVCQCDGSFQCPPERTIDICRRRVPTTQRPRETRCLRCQVSDKQQFEGNTEFSLQRGCNKFTCSCACDGSWDCPPSKTVDTCSESYRRNGDTSRTTK